MKLVEKIGLVVAIVSVAVLIASASGANSIIDLLWWIRR